MNFLIGIKYCGGCNPRYERPQIVDKLKEAYQELEVELAKEQKEYDLVVVVCGCPSKCASHQTLVGRYGKVLTASLEDFHLIEAKMEEIKALGGD